MGHRLGSRRPTPIDPCSDLRPAERHSSGFRFPLLLRNQRVRWRQSEFAIALPAVSLLWALKGIDAAAHESLCVLTVCCSQSHQLARLIAAAAWVGLVGFHGQYWFTDQFPTGDRWRRYWWWKRPSQRHQTNSSSSASCSGKGLVPGWTCIR